MNIIRSTSLWLAIYAAMFVFTFGNYMATPRVCEEYPVSHWTPCSPVEEGVAAALAWPIYWPLYWSWEAQS